jgi:hypothetical protein
MPSGQAHVRGGSRGYTRKLPMMAESPPRTLPHVDGTTIDVLCSLIARFVFPKQGPLRVNPTGIVQSPALPDPVPMERYSHKVAKVILLKRACDN